MLLMQSLLNLLIYAMFMSLTFQSILVFSQPLSIDDLKHEYMQLQIDHLSSRYQGASINMDKVCFTTSQCIVSNNHRLILTPGYQILMENISNVEVKEHDTIEIHFEHHRIQRVWQVKKKSQR